PNRFDHISRSFSDSSSSILSRFNDSLDHSWRGGGSFSSSLTGCQEGFDFFFTHDKNLQIGGNFRTQTYRDVIRTQFAQCLLADAAAVDVDAGFLVQGIGDVSGGDRTEQFAGVGSAASENQF